MADQKLAEFLGSVPPPAITWRKYIGPDFDVYYGHANPPLSGEISFYLGCCSGFTPEPQSSIVEGKLGRFSGAMAQKNNRRRLSHPKRAGRD